MNCKINWHMVLNWTKSISIASVKSLSFWQFLKFRPHLVCLLILQMCFWKVPRPVLCLTSLLCLCLVLFKQESKLSQLCEQHTILSLCLTDMRGQEQRREAVLGCERTGVAFMLTYVENRLKLEIGKGGLGLYRHLNDESQFAHQNRDRQQHTHTQKKRKVYFFNVKW